MNYLRSDRTIFRKLILLGWAFVVVWIYMGNLVNFHQNRIWGKQLIPLACYSTRAKEKEGLLVDKSDTDSRITLPGLHYDFTISVQQSLNLVLPYLIISKYNQSDTPLIHSDFTSFSLRGPPAA